MKAFGYSIATGEAPHPDGFFQPRFQRVGESLLLPQLIEVSGQLLVSR